MLRYSSLHCCKRCRSGEVKAFFSTAGCLGAMHPRQIAPLSRISRAGTPPGIMQVYHMTVLNVRGPLEDWCTAVVNVGMTSIASSLADQSGIPRDPSSLIVTPQPAGKSTLSRLLQHKDCLGLLPLSAELNAHIVGSCPPHPCSHPTTSLPEGSASVSSHHVRHPCSPGGAR